MDLNTVRETSPLPEGDKKARLEDKALFRDESLKDAVHWVSRSLIFVFFILFLFILGVRVWHLLSPNAWRWLSELEVNGIDKIVFSGTVGGILGGYLKDKFIKN